MPSPGPTTFSFYPGETPLYEGDIHTLPFERDDEFRSPSLYVQVDSEGSYNFAISSLVQHPFRTQYTGCFLHRTGNIAICNVDLELDEQPSDETIARALLRAMEPDL